MIDACLYLVSCSIRNRIRLRLRRLRQPRYLIGSIVGLVYLYTMVFRRAIAPPMGRDPRGGRELPPGVLALIGRISGPIAFLGAMGLFVAAAAAWLLPGAGQPIEFTRSEVQFLFQAPITRKALLHYKLLRGQVGAIVGSAIATVFLRPASFASAWTFLVGMWLLFATLRLHFTGVALRRQSLAQHGESGLRRQWLPLVVVTVAVLTLVATVADDWPSLSSMASAGDVFEELRRLSSSGPASVVLWPFRAVVTLPLTATPMAFLRALPVPLVLLFLNYAWVLRGDAAFEEASAAYAERRAAERGRPSGARRAGKAVASPFRLGLSGRPEIAILWKNLILLGRYASMRVLFRFVPLVVVLGVLISRSAGAAGVSSLVAGFSLLFAAMTILIGPQAMRNDLRQDLGSLAVLKSWPVRGAALVRGELLAPTAALSVLAWLLIFTSAVFIRANGGDMALPPFVQESSIALAWAAGLLAPALIVTQLVLHNGMAVLFPAWVTVGTARARGIDAMGQRVLMMAAVMLSLVLALVPAAVAAGIVGFAISTMTRTAPIVAPAMVATVVVIAECWIASEMLGRVLDRMDVSAVEVVE